MRVLFHFRSTMNEVCVLRFTDHIHSFRPIGMNIAMIPSTTNSKILVKSPQIKELSIPLKYLFDTLYS